MLVAKITPAASFAKQENPFTITTTSADTILVLARPYVLGSKEVNFEVLFGNVVAATEAVEASEGVEAIEASPTKFVVVASDFLVLNQEDLQDWGTDDLVVFNLIATKLSVSIDSTEVF